MRQDQQHRIERARLSLEGLSVGDAFGQRFFLHPAVVRGLIAERALPAAPWAFTDDTQMALSIVAVLREHGGIDQDRLAASFAARFDPGRGYGRAMEQLLPRIGRGEHWQVVARSLFGGEGSYGNGAAMRVAPLGAYFADDREAAVAQAGRSAEVTHAHPEAVAGAIAVAIAAAQAWLVRGAEPLPSRSDFLDLILPHIPNGAVRRGIVRARDLSPDTSVDTAVSLLGNGRQVTTQDTVPFALWCAGQRLGSFEDAIWLTASGLGDVDTNCAIVGGIVALSTREPGIPADWLSAREHLPEWPFRIGLFESIRAARLTPNG